MQLDLVQAMTYVSDLVNALRDIRTEAAFSKLFEEAALLADLLQSGIVLSKPRTASRSVYRAAAGADGLGCTTEEYYRVNYYFATLDAVITPHATSAQGPHSFHRGSHRQIRYDFCAQIEICVVVGSFIEIIAQFCLVNVTMCHMCCVHAISIQDMATFAVPLAWVYIKY